MRIAPYEPVYDLPPPRDVIDAEVVGEEPSFALPWDIDDRIREVDAAAEDVDRRVRASRQQLGAEFVAGWTRFAEHWRRFYRAHQSILHHAVQGDLRWSDLHERVVEYELRVAQWRRAAEARGVVFPTPAATPRAPRSAAVGADLRDDAKPLAIAAAVGLSALAVIAVVNKLS